MEEEAIRTIRFAAEKIIKFRDSEDKADLEDDECATCNEYGGHVASHLEWTKGDSCHMCHQNWSLVATPDRVLALAKGYPALRHALNRLYAVQSKHCPGHKQSWDEAMKLSLAALTETQP